MSDISTELNAIMNARYGKDVRRSIHDSIYKIDENLTVSRLKTALFEEFKDGLIKKSEWSSATFSSDSGTWISNKKYPGGFVKSITVHTLGSGTKKYTAYIYEDNGDGTATLTFTNSASGNGDIKIPINYFVSSSYYYIGINAPSSAYAIKGDGIYSVAATTEKVIRPDSFSQKYYHAYEVTMSAANESIYKYFINKKYGVETVGEQVIDFASTDYQNKTVLDLPLNRIFKIANGKKRNGFPIEDKHSTLIKLSPNFSDSTSTGYCLYLYAAILNNKYDTRLYYAYAIDNQTVDNLKWREIVYDKRTTNPKRGIKSLGLTSDILSIVFIGDSIVEGYGSSDYNGGADGSSGHLIQNNVKTWYRNTGNKCWANKMIKYLTETFNNVRACNNGIGGLTSEQLYDNLETLTVDDHGNRADVVILSIGTNDRYKDKISSIVTPIQNSIEWLINKGIQPIILTNTPIVNAKKGNNAETIQSSILTACINENVECYDLLSRMKYYLWEHDIPIEASTDQSKVMHDDLHPSDMGYEIMFEIIKSLLIV